MTGLQNTKRHIIYGAIQSNLESPLAKAQRVRVRGQIIRFAVASFMSATVVLAVTSILIARGKAAPGIAAGANTAQSRYSVQSSGPSVPLTPPTELSHAVLPLSIKRIVIDPGHGGQQPGAKSSSGLLEKDVTLDIAFRLRRLLNDSSFEVLLTRDADQTVSLADRVAFANSKRADLFVSIHINSMQPRSVHPLETYYVGPSDDPHVLELAGVENHGAAYSLSEYRQLLDKVFLDSRRNESHLLANSIDAELYGSLKQLNPELQDRGVKTAPFAVLIGTQMPAVLAEVSSVSNNDDARLLKDEQYRQKIAIALSRGISNYANNLNGSGRKGNRPNGKT